MHKFFTLALITLSSASISYAALDDTQVLDKEATTVNDINLQSFTSCEAMDSVLTSYFKKALQDQMSMYGTPEKPLPAETDASKPANPTPARAEGMGGGGDGNFSQTNVQIA